jgi:hypothetical protein
VRATLVNVREIPHSQWPAFFDQFSRTYRAWLVTLRTTSPAPAHIEAAHPLRSITPFVHNDRVVHIDIRFQDDAPGQDPLRILAPVSVRAEENTAGVTRGLRIVDDKGGSTYLRFRAAPSLEMLDGIGPGEASP